MNVTFLFITSSLLLGAPNPVLPGVADAGVFRHAGTYYIMGVGTSGGVYTSEDLVHWSGPVQAFSMKNAWAIGPAATDDNIHACDMVLHNGVFHLYWSVNNGDLRQIGHAVADAPTGPFLEPITDSPFDGRIDPQCFQDDDGRYYFYTVKFLTGNIIFGQPMTGPQTLSGASWFLLIPRFNTWETADTPATFINEGPFVVRYRQRYYMIYNANHTGGEYGNYALGVAESETPLGFNNATKYDFPVLRSNRDFKYAGVEPDPALPLVKNCGQPNLVRGPNGIEWWLVYFADREHRAQYIDRAHFFGRELFLEGPTTADTPGYHPVPALPSFRDLFEREDTLDAGWDSEGPWRIDEGALHAPEDIPVAVARARLPESRHYIIETTLRYHGNGNGRFGVVAWDDGRGSRALIGLDRVQNAAFRLAIQGRHKREWSVPLPPGFNWDGPHTLRIENNAGNLTVYLGPLLLDRLGGRIRSDAPGSTGLFAEGCSPAFDSFSCTRGWDEYGRAFRGWSGPAGHLHPGSARGLVLRPGQSVFKGDALRHYEFSTQIQEKGTGGLYPVYVDEANFLRVVPVSGFTEIKVTGMHRGEAIPERVFPVRPRVHRAHGASGNGNHLRAVKLADRVVLFVEGLELGEIEGSWQDSRVGLFAAGDSCTFDGLTLFELP